MHYYYVINLHRLTGMPLFLQHIFWSAKNHNWITIALYKSIVCVFKYIIPIQMFITGGKRNDLSDFIIIFIVNVNNL